VGVILAMKEQERYKEKREGMGVKMGEISFKKLIPFHEFAI